MKYKRKTKSTKASILQLIIMMIASAFILFYLSEDVDGLLDAWANIWNDSFMG
jgi:hypothetical protein